VYPDEEIVTTSGDTMPVKLAPPKFKVAVLVLSYIFELTVMPVTVNAFAVISADASTAELEVSC